MSMNTEIGKAECMRFFPIGYKNSSECGEPTPEPINDEPKKRKRKRKTKQDSDENDTQVSAAPQQTHLEQVDLEGGDEEDEEEDDGSITGST